MNITGGKFTSLLKHARKWGAFPIRILTAAVANVSLFVCLTTSVILAAMIALSMLALLVALAILCIIFLCSMFACFGLVKLGDYIAGENTLSFLPGAWIITARKNIKNELSKRTT